MNHPKLIGKANNIAEELRSIEDVARFIIGQGLRGDVQITYADGRPFLNTFGMYIDRIADMDYRERLLKILIPMQQEIEAQACCSESGNAPEPMTQDEIDIICARHVLWLHDAGGEQADFSGCFLQNAKLCHRNLMNAVLRGARLSGCDLRDCELNFSDCSGAQFEECDMDGIYADETDFSQTVMTHTSIRHTYIAHADFSGARLKSCRLDSTKLQNCCFDGTVFEDTDEEMAYLINPSYDRAEWSEDAQPAMTGG